MKYCTHCGNENRSSSNFCQSCGKKLDTNNKRVKEKKNSNNKLILSIIAILIVILAGAGYMFKDTLFNSKDSFMKEYNSALASANSGDFNEAKNKLTQIQTKDKFDDVNVEDDIKIVTDLNTIEKLLMNDNVDELSNKLNDFENNYKNNSSKFVDAGSSLIKDSSSYIKYNKDLTSFNNYLDKEDISNAKTSLDKLKTYNFNLDKLAEKTKTTITDSTNKLEQLEKNSQSKKAVVEETRVATTSGGVGDNDVIPPGSSAVFGGTVTNSTTYKEFRQTSSYQLIATNFIGFNASNAQIKACLEWLIKKGREGAQGLPSTEEYQREVGR